MEQIVNSVCLYDNSCVRLSVRLSTLSRSSFLIDFHQKWHRGNNPEREEGVRSGQHHTTPSPISPPEPQFWGVNRRFQA